MIEIEAVTPPSPTTCVSCGKKEAFFTIRFLAEKSGFANTVQLCDSCIVDLVEKTQVGRGLMALVDDLKHEQDVIVEEVNRLQSWINDLQAGMFINCVYCGHRYGPDDEVPATMADALKEHIEQCPKHPMSKYKQVAERVRKLKDKAFETTASPGIWKWPGHMMERPPELVGLIIPVEIVKQLLGEE